MALPTDLIQDFPDDNTTTEDAPEESETDVQDTTNDDTPEDTDNESESDDSEKSVDEPDESAEDDDEGYFADDGDSDDTTTAPELPAAPANFSAEEKYIVDNLPLISVRVKMADDSVKTMQVRSAAELPRDMRGIATPYEDKQFDLANTAQETRARELQTYYRQHQTQLETQEFEKKENQSIRDDIAELQREGEIPKFKAQPGTRAFDSDPAAQRVQEVIEFMNDRNAKYLERANKGGSYRHIGFAEAYELMSNGTKADSKNSSTRKDAAKKLVSKQGGSTTKTSKAPVSGKTLKDVASEFEDFEV